MSISIKNTISIPVRLLVLKNKRLTRKQELLFTDNIKMLFGMSFKYIENSTAYLNPKF
jgi:hypothetical protein